MTVRNCKSHRWFAFRLWTLLVVVTLAALPLAWLRWELDLRRKEQMAIEWVVGHDRGTVNRGKSERGELHWWSSWTHRRYGGDIGHASINSPVDDLSRLADFRTLTTLNLGPVETSDLSPLGRLRRLTRLSMHGAEMDDLTPLGRLGELERLSLSGGFSDLGPLANLKQLREVQLSNNQAHHPVTDLSPLAGLERLEKLSILWNRDLRDVRPLSNIATLTYLRLHDTSISDLSPLASLKNLRRLDLDCSPVADLSPLAHLNNLEYLSLVHTRASDLSPLAALPKLKHLRLDNSPVRDLTPIARMASLEKLEIRNASSQTIRDFSTRTEVTNLGPLAESQSLKTVEVIQVDGDVDLAPLTRSKTITQLKLNGTVVKDLFALQHMSSLRKLEFTPKIVLDDDYLKYHQQAVALQRKIPNCYITYDMRPLR